MSKIIVFDFDKTLTKQDTLFGFFRHATKKSLLYWPKLVLYSICMVLTKLKLISNTQLKDIGIRFFLRNLNQSELQEKCKSYSKHIRFNSLFMQMKWRKENQYVVISASFEDYVRPIFPNFVRVFGSTIAYKNQKASKTLFNCYKEEKLKVLKENNIAKIDVLYTDSFSDFALAKIAKQSIIVNGETLISCNTFDEFKSYFGK